MNMNIQCSIALNKRNVKDVQEVHKDSDIIFEKRKKQIAAGEGGLGGMWFYTTANQGGEIGSGERKDDYDKTLLCLVILF